MTHRTTLGFLLAAVWALAAVGCTSSTSEPPAVESTGKDVAGDSGEGDDSSSSNAAVQQPAEPEEVRLEPYDAPPLAELDAKAQWEEQPIRDAMHLLRERQSKEKVLATVEEATSLKNDSPRANERILSAIGRLPESEADVDWDASIVRHSPADVRSTNPLMQSSTIEQELISLTGLYLFGYDWNFDPFANEDVVKSWQSSKDHLLDKIVLRDDLTWSDGKPVTAHDIVFSFQTIMNPKIPIPAVRSGTEKLRWIEAYDDHTLVIFHKEALATNVWNMFFPIVPKHVYENSISDDPTLQDSDYHVKLEAQPVVGGPYELSERARGQSMLLTRRESWYMHNGKQVRDKPHFKEVRFRIIEDPNTALLSLKGGTIEEMELQPDQWTSQTVDNEFYKLNTKVSGLQWLYFYFGWNIDSQRAPFFTDKRVRKAMSFAFDHDEMLGTLLYGLYEPSNGIYHHTAWTAPKDAPAPYKRNLDKAEDLLDEAGWEDSDGDGLRDKTINGRKVDFEFTVVTSNRPLRIAICTLLKNNLEEIGVRCHVSPLDFPTLQEKVRTHDFQAHMGGWGTGADPDTSENLWATGEGRNFVQYSNPQVDDLFKQGRQEFDRQKRAAIYAQIHNILYEDQPYTWLYFQSSFYGINKNLRGFVFSPRGPYTYGPGFDAIWKPAQ
jgi:peptide/nickel transport system substrate-binding protein